MSGGGSSSNGSSGGVGDILSDFPGGFTPRAIQRDILKSVEQHLASGYKRIILSAPTGVGKSLIAATVAAYCDSSSIVTATKQLQDQYSRDLSFLMPIKGKSNFACPKLMKSKSVHSAARAKRQGLTCDKGRCVEKVSKNGRVVEETCQFKPKIKDVADGKYGADSCEYYMQKYRALVAPHALWNYASYFQTIKYNQKTFAEYLGRGITIFDEAHKIEDQIIQFIGIDIRRGELDECGMTVDAYDLSDISSIIDMADGLATHYARALKDLESSRAFALKPDHEAYARLESRYKRASQARVEMTSDPKNFVINRPDTDAGGGFRSVSIRPINISRYVEELFGDGTQMYMSATIDLASFCENTGIDPGEVAVVDAPKSPFPVEHRRVDFLDVRRLNSRSTPDDRLAVIKKIDEIMAQHAGDRGLILTSSVQWCREIMGGLSEPNRARIRMCHSRNDDGRTQDDILDEHAGTTGSVLLSSSLWEGVDLKDDLSRFQIIAKVPYPNLGERRVSEKMHLFPMWYDAQTVTKLLQGLGRSVRNGNDWARTYVLDASVHHVLSKARARVPKSYHDALGWG